MTTQQKGQVAGLLGAVLFFSALFAWFLTERFSDPWVIAQLALALSGLAAWLLTNRGRLGGQVGTRGAFFGVLSTATALVVVAALVGLNYIAVKKPDAWLFKSRDFTKDKVFTLSDQTEGVLRGLKDKVKLRAFFGSTDPEMIELSTRLRQYGELTDKLEVEYVDPIKHPSEVQASNIAPGGPRLVVRAGAKEARAKDISEEGLTNAIAEVTRGSSKKIYFSKGHGEHAIADNTERGFKAFVDNLKSEGYAVDELVLTEHKAMPDDAQALVVGGPVAGFTTGESKLVADYVGKGGKVVALIDPGVGSGLDKDLATFGINLGNDEIIDLESQDYEYATAMPAVEHPITKAKSLFAVASILPLARSVQKAQNVPAGWSVTELYKTGPRSWGEVDPIVRGKQIEYTPGRDVKGPVPVAVAATHGAGEQEARVVVIGNSMFAANGFYRFLGNRDLAMNAVAWVAHEEAKIAIRPKSRQANHLFLTADQVHTMKIFAFDVLPFSLLFAGLLVWQTRRSR